MIQEGLNDKACQVKLWSFFDKSIWGAVNAVGDKQPAWKYAVEIVRSLVLATVVAGLSERLDIEGLAGAALLGLALWIGFPVTLLTGSVQWENVPWRLAALHAGDWLLKLLVIAAVVTLWR